MKLPIAPHNRANVPQISLVVVLIVLPTSKARADGPGSISEAERGAIAEITRLGGWVETDKLGDVETVVRVNMVYYEPEGGKRLENSNLSSEALAVVPAFTNLEWLMLKGTQVTDEGLTHIRGMRHLERIYMWDAALVTNKGVEHLMTIPTLKYVHLSNSRITDEALLHFSALESLEGLSLQGNEFTDEGMRHLTPLKNLKRLAIGLGACRVTDAGLEPIGALENLELLDLQHSSVTDDGLIHLVKLKKLRSLWAGKSRITQEGAELLRQVMPDLEVLH